MDAEQLEKQFQRWNHFMYMVLGSSITLVIVSMGNFVNGHTWSGFDNYTGSVWTWILLFAVLPGFYLLLSKRWKTIPPGNRLNTVFGYFIASWFCVLALAFIIAPNNMPDELNFIIAGSAILIALGYIWALKKTSNPRDEIFP